MAGPVTAENAVLVEGLSDLRRELGKLNLTDDLKDVNFRAGEIIVKRAQQNAASLSSMQQNAAATLKSSRQAARAVVTLGKNSVPYALGAEFGAGRDIKQAGRNRGYTGLNQFEPWRGRGADAGYFLWPAIRDSAQEVLDMYGDELEKLTKSAFPD